MLKNFNVKKMLYIGVKLHIGTFKTSINNVFVTMRMLQ